MALKNSGISADLTLSTEDFNKALNEARAQVKYFEEAVHRAGASGGGGAAGGGGLPNVVNQTRQAGAEAGRTARRYMLIGQVMDDLQYGIRGVTNQIGQMAMEFGNGSEKAMKMAGVATAFAVSTIFAYDQVKKVIDSEKQIKQNFKNSAAEFKEYKRNYELETIMIETRRETERWTDAQKTAMRNMAEQDARIQNIRDHEAEVHRMRMENMAAELAADPTKTREEKIASLAEMEKKALKEAADRRIREASLDANAANKAESAARDEYVNARRRLTELENLEREFHISNEERREKATLEGRIGTYKEILETAQARSRNISEERRQAIDAREDTVPQQTRAIEMRAQQEAADAFLKKFEEITRAMVAGMRARGEFGEANKRENELNDALKRAGLIKEGFSSKQADYITEQNRAQANDREKRTREETMADLEIQEDRAGGRNRRARKRADERRKRQEQEELDAQGFTPEQRADIMERRERLRRRQERPGRIIGAGHGGKDASKGSGSRLDDYQSGESAMDKFRKEKGLSERGVFSQTKSPAAKAEAERRRQEKAAKEKPPVPPINPALNNLVAPVMRTLNDIYNVVKNYKPKDESKP